MGGGTPRKSYSKIKNFTEKDQVRLKYSYIGKSKRLMLSVYIGEDVYNELTNGQNFKRLKVEYIPNDMVIITPTDNEKEGIVHRYNGKGLFKTTCVRLSLSSYKTLKIGKKDFNNRVAEYNIWFDTAHIYGCNKLNVDLIGSKKPRFVNKVYVNDVVPQSYVSDIKPLEPITPIQYPYNCDSRILDYSMGEGYVTHDCLNDVRDAIENRLVDMEEKFEKRIQATESLLKEFMEQPLRPLKADKGNSLDIDTLKQLVSKISDEIKIKFSNLEKAIGELDIKNTDIKSRLSLILNLVSNKKPDENKSLFERIFGKD